ncbi:Homeodomain protein, partial [Euroglyphus maynei]
AASHPSSIGLRPLASLSFAAGFPWATRGKPRRGMMRRAVFSDAQRQGLEKRFQMQKYISKPDRKKLAEKLGLKDSQVSLIQKKN